MRNVSDKRREKSRKSRKRRGNQNTHSVFSNFFRRSYRVRDNVGKYVVQWSRPQMTVCRMRIACWTPKATNTHSVCVMLSSTKMAARTCLNVTLYEQCRCCLFVCLFCLSIQLKGSITQFIQTKFTRKILKYDLTFFTHSHKYSVYHFRFRVYKGKKSIDSERKRVYVSTHVLS